MVIGAYGHAGKLIMREAIRRGHAVVGVAHRIHTHESTNNIVIKDMMDLTKADISNVDAIVDAVGAWTAGTEAVHYNGLEHITQLIAGTSIHYLKIGGANTLFIDKKHQHTLQELPLYYPDYMQDVCNAHAEGLKILRTYDDVNWTYVTPTFNFDPNGQKTGNYQVEGEEIKVPSSHDPNDGKHDYISYADFSKAVIDIVEQHKFVHQRITLVSGDNPHPTWRY